MYYNDITTRTEGYIQDGVRYETRRGVEVCYHEELLIREEEERQAENTGLIL